MSHPCDVDVLGLDAIEFARKAARAGVDVRLRVEPGGFHVYVLSVPFIPEAVAGLRALLRTPLPRPRQLGQTSRITLITLIDNFNQ